jgi:mRNA interferase RelE/StbE
MAYKVVLKRSAGKELESLPEKDRTRAISALRGLAADPFQGKKLQGNLAGLYSLRVWPLRIIYQVSQKMVTVTVVAIGHRQGVYQRS